MPSVNSNLFALLRKVSYITLRFMRMGRGKQRPYGLYES
jgi:hypothetical protein